MATKSVIGPEKRTASEKDCRMIMQGDGLFVTKCINDVSATLSERATANPNSLCCSAISTCSRMSFQRRSFAVDTVRYTFLNAEPRRWRYVFKDNSARTDQHATDASHCRCG